MTSGSPQRPARSMRIPAHSPLTIYATVSLRLHALRQDSVGGPSMGAANSRTSSGRLALWAAAGTGCSGRCCDCGEQDRLGGDDTRRPGLDALHVVGFLLPGAGGVALGPRAFRKATTILIPLAFLGIGQFGISGCAVECQSVVLYPISAVGPSIFHLSLHDHAAWPPPWDSEALSYDPQDGRRSD